MSVADVAQLMTAMGLLLNGVVTLLSYLQSVRNGKKIEQVHLATNGMKEALVASTAKENFAAGLLQGAENTTGPRRPRSE
jgi:hypothetical protein